MAATEKELKPALRAPSKSFTKAPTKTVRHLRMAKSASELLAMQRIWCGTQLHASHAQLSVHTSGPGCAHMKCVIFCWEEWALAYKLSPGGGSRVGLRGPVRASVFNAHPGSGLGCGAATI